ncbi:hypothetical protein ACFWUZ_36110 [Streptomyces sp. NPDC058646]|uniref:hypothetical protein n=1 Tax=Streptomyces sp. NPDC058646 TaxID=3346574 RepID=UPI0036631420
MSRTDGDQLPLLWTPQDRKDPMLMAPHLVYAREPLPASGFRSHRIPRLPRVPTTRAVLASW